jgi:hypothetical protein
MNQALKSVSAMGANVVDIFINILFLFVFTVLALAVAVYSYRLMLVQEKRG